jgi:hypothetical protein
MKTGDFQVGIEDGGKNYSVLFSIREMKDVGADEVTKEVEAIVKTLAEFKNPKKVSNWSEWLPATTPYKTN